MKKIKLPFQKEMPVIGIRIIESKYANDFVNNGVIHFSCPSEWRNKDRKTGHRLDELEGCFCLSPNANDNEFYRINRPFRKEFCDGMYRYFEDFNDLAACCFYGINKSCFKDRRIKYGVKEFVEYYTTVSLSYFKEFDGANGSNGADKKVILIFDFPAFINRITEALEKMGCRREEIIVFPAYYQNKSVPFYVSERFPFSFFVKDESYREQSELRILICTNNKAFWNAFKSNNMNIEIGDISKITRVEDYYEDDLYLSIQGDDLLYSLAHPIKEKIEDLSFAKLVILVYQVLQNQLPGEPLEQSDIEERVFELSRILQEKHGVKLCDDWRLENVSPEQAAQLPELIRGMIRYKT